MNTYQKNIKEAKTKTESSRILKFWTSKVLIGKSIEPHNMPEGCGGANLHGVMLARPKKKPARLLMREALWENAKHFPREEGAAPA